MNQINLHRIKWSRIIIGILIGIILISFFTCESNNRDNAAREKKYNDSISVVNTRIKNYQSNNEILEVEKQIVIEDRAKIQKELTALYKSYEVLERQNLNARAVIMKFTGDDIIAFHNKKYNLPDQIKKGPFGIETTENLGRLIVADLSSGENCNNRVANLKNQIAKFRSDLKKSDSLIKIESKQKDNFNLMYLDAEKKFSFCSSELATEKKDNKKEVVFRLLGGGGAKYSNLYQEVSFNANAAFQNKRGDILEAGISNKKEYTITYLISIFKIKK